MTFLPKSVWRYAVLIVILFAIVAVASNSIITHIENNIPDPQYEQIIQQITVGVWTLTLGVLFLAGALGLWAIRSSSEIESCLRIGRFVDAMDYLNDGLLVLDKTGRVMGSNPSIKQLTHQTITEQVTLTLREIFPSLTAQDNDYLMKSGQTREIERDCVYPNGLRTLRFRSQLSENVILVFVSDVTTMRSEQIIQRQTAQIQLVGRIASGVANDFNDILCAIAGHSALLQRLDLDAVTMKKSVDIIINETQRGALLSKQLLELSRSGKGGNPSKKLDENVEEAAGLMRFALSPEWTVKTVIDGKYPAVPLTSAQVVQIVLNLGLLVSDAQASPGTIMITLNKPGQGHLLDVGNQFVAVILISAESVGLDSTSQSDKALEEIMPVHDETGVITSVVQSIVEEAHGRLDHLIASSGLQVYRVCLPHLYMEKAGVEDALLSADELNVCVSQWRVLLADSTHEMEVFERRLSTAGTAIEKKDNVASVLAYVQSNRNLDAMVLNKRMLGPESDALLQVILKLSSDAEIVVLCQDPKQESAQLREEIMFRPYSTNPDEIIQSILDAKACPV